MAREVSAESFSQSSHERIQMYLRNLFDVPTKNIETAFELILGLVKEQTSQIVDLNNAHLEVVEKNEKICASMQNAFDGIARENAGLSADLRKLKEEHSLLRQSHATLSSLIDTLRHETELTYILLGDIDSEPESALTEDKNTNIQENTDADIIEIELNHSNRGVKVEHLYEGTNIDDVTSGVNVGDEQCENRVRERFHSSAKRSCSRSLRAAAGGINFPMNPERTVMARLCMLEQSLASLTEKTTSTGQVEHKLVDVKRRIDYIEAVLQGFKQDHNEADAFVEQELKQSVQEENSALITVKDISGRHSAENLKSDSHHGDVNATPMFGAFPRGQWNFTQHGGNEGNTKIIAIHDTAHPISSLSENKQARQVAPPSDIAAEKIGGGYDVVLIERQVEDLSYMLRKQISELLISVNDKVSISELENRLLELRNLISTCSTEGSTRAFVFDQEQKILELKTYLESNMVDKDDYKRQLEHLETDMNSLICREISQLRVDFSTNIESQRHELMCLRDELILRLGSSIKQEHVNAKIQEATDALRVSLDERMDAMRLLENEMDFFASKLAEKPTQDQVDSVLRLFDKRLGHDVELQGVLENLKLELKQKMSKGEVMALMKQTVRQAKLGMQNTKNTLMIGATPAYCLGCGGIFPAGVNGMRTLKVNHDALPLSSAKFHNEGVSIRSGSRDVNKVQGLGSFALSSTFVPKNIHK